MNHGIYVKNTFLFTYKIIKNNLNLIFMNKI